MYRILYTYIVYGLNAEPYKYTILIIKVYHIYTYCYTYDNIYSIPQRKWDDLLLSVRLIATIFKKLNLSIEARIV